MDLMFVGATLAKRGLLNPGPPGKVLGQLNALRKWGFSLCGELRSAAARNPQRVALIDDQRGEITYGQLLNRAERVARALRGGLGIGEGDRVGLLARNHADLIAAMVAAGLVGADAVMINTGLSAPQLATVAEQQQLKVLLHDNEFTALVAAIPTGVEKLDEQALERAVAMAPPRSVTVPTREGRTIVLTSGTTGAPKGACRPTPGGFGPLASIIDRIPVHAGDRLMISAPIFHTWGYAALQIAFAMRATVVLQRRFEPAGALGAVVRHQVRGLFAVPVMVQRLLETAPHGLKENPLKIVAVSGSALPGGLAIRFMDAFGDVLYNLYGSTEASWASIATPPDMRRSPGTAGRPPHGTRVLILGFDGEPAPPGQVGRIFVGNDMLFEGYTSGTGREVHEGLMSTGDLGHLTEDGLLQLDGREDDMIISGGENVFPAEVEDLLARLPQVREVAVVGVTDPQYGQRLAAYLALHPGEQLDPDAVREYVKHYLARFAVPREVHFVAALPRNATGKVMTRYLQPGT